MLAEPLLRWWQPVRGGDDGALYLWARRGTAGRCVDLLHVQTARWHEMHHARAPLSCGQAGRGHLARRQGLEHLAARPRLHAGPERRSSGRHSPRSIAADASFRAQFSANTIDSKGSTWTLRPLVKPLYRYESKSDGALFALVQGTDPEAFVVLEAKGDGKDAHWEYAVARFTDLEIRVRLKDREVFSGPHTLGGAHEMYHTLAVMSKPSDSPADFE